MDNSASVSYTSISSIFKLHVSAVGVQLPGKLAFAGIVGASKGKLHLRDNFKDDSISPKTSF